MVILVSAIKKLIRQNRSKDKYNSAFRLKHKEREALIIAISFMLMIGAYIGALLLIHYI